MTTGVDPEVVSACRGTHVPEAQPPTPAQRRFLRWYFRAVAVALLGWVVAQHLRDGPQGGAHVLTVVVLALVAGVVGDGLARRLGRHVGGLVTRVDDDGLFARTGWREERTLAWADVVAIDPPGGFHLWPTAVLVGGSRQELPGLPADVAERLDAVLLVARGEGRRPRPRPTEVRSPGDDRWVGPFHRSGPPR